MPERERPQERAQRRRRGDPRREQLARGAAAQDVGVIDAVGAEHHRVDEAHELAPRIGRSDPVTEAHKPARERLDPEAIGERRDQHDPGVADRPLIVEHDGHSVRSGRSFIVHHEGDLLRGTRMPLHP